MCQELDPGVGGALPNEMNAPRWGNPWIEGGASHAGEKWNARFANITAVSGAIPITPNPLVWSVIETVTLSLRHCCRGAVTSHEGSVPWPDRRVLLRPIVYSLPH